MKKSRYTDEQIVRILREADQGKLSEVAKRYVVFEASRFVWRKRVMGMGVDEVRRLRTLEIENSCLKRDPGIEVMKEIAAKKWCAHLFV